MEKSQTSGTNMIFVCYVLLKEANIHINLICFDHNFDLHTSMKSPLSLRKQSEKPQFFPENTVICRKSFKYLPALRGGPLFLSGGGGFLFHKKIVCNCSWLKKIVCFKVMKKKNCLQSKGKFLKIH